MLQWPSTQFKERTGYIPAIDMRAQFPAEAIVLFFKLMVSTSTCGGSHSNGPRHQAVPLTRALSTHALRLDLRDVRASARFTNHAIRDPHLRSSDVLALGDNMVPQALLVLPWRNFSAPTVFEVNWEHHRTSAVLL